MKFLIVVDMQKDFVDGALGTKEAVEILPNVVRKIREFDGKVVVTMDTHQENYMETQEGRMLPVPHCIQGTPGWELSDEVFEAVKDGGRRYEVYTKPTFGSMEMATGLFLANHDGYIENQTSGDAAIDAAIEGMHQRNLHKLRPIPFYAHR